MNKLEAHLSCVDHRLRGGPPAPPPPASLHESVMRAVRETPPLPAASLACAWHRVGIAVLLCFLFASLWGGSTLLRSHFAPSPFSSSASAKLNQQMVELPSIVVSPLSQEWQSLNADLVKTREFLLASVP